MQTCPAVAGRTVIFDFYGTLVGSAAPGRTIVDLMLALGVTITPEVAAKWDIDHLDGVLHEEASRSEDDYRRWQDARFYGMLSDCQVPQHRQEGIVHAIGAQIASFRVRAFPESVAVLAELRERGYQLGICSNWHWDLDSYLDDTGLAGAVDLAITSARIGARKHHPLIYQRTLDALGADPVTTVFVGDSWLPDVIGPIDAGMRAIHVARGERPTPPLPDGAVRVSDLTGVLAHL